MSHNADGVASACDDVGGRAALSRSDFASCCYNHAARLHSRGPVLDGPARQRSSGDGGMAGATKIKTTPGAFFFSCRTVCVDQSQAQARAANRRRPSPAAAEQDTLETKLPTPKWEDLAGRPLRS